MSAEWDRIPWVMGLSAQAIACRSGANHPHDPGDLVRCVKFCEFRGYSTATLRERMAGRSVQWDRLLVEWDNLVALLKHEIETRTDGNAPATYIEMRRVMADGIACDACHATGRGVECAACKGTGRRSGGRCRAEHCFSGAAPCQTCRGYGYCERVTVRREASA